MRTLVAPPFAGTLAVAHLLLLSGAWRHPVAARDAARRGLPGVIRLSAIRDPDAVVLIRGAESITAAALDADVRALAAGIENPQGSRVGVRSDGGIGFVATLAAAVAAGLDAVPLGPRLSPGDVAGLGLDDILEVRRPASSGPAPLPLPIAQPGRVLLLTTGTTGSPVATARGRIGLRALAQLADADRRIGLPGDGPLLLLAPPDHGHGLSGLVSALLRGIPVVLASGMRPEEQAELVARHDPASISGVPVQLARLLDAGGFGRARVVATGSSALDPGLRARLEAARVVVHDGFGSTATGTVAVDGRPLAGVRLRRTPEGSLEVRAPLGGERWIATGDVVSFGGGRLHPAGRVGGLVDSGGELVDPGRLQGLLRAHPGVAGCVVLVVPDDLVGSVLHARVDADPRLEGEIRASIAARLSRAEHPRRLEFGALPGTG